MSANSPPGFPAADPYHNFSSPIARYRPSSDEGRVLLIANIVSPLSRAASSIELLSFPLAVFHRIESHLSRVTRRQTASSIEKPVTPAAARAATCPLRLRRTTGRKWSSMPTGYRNRSRDVSACRFTNNGHLNTFHPPAERIEETREREGWQRRRVLEGHGAEADAGPLRQHWTGWLRGACQGARCRGWTFKCEALAAVASPFRAVAFIQFGAL